MKEEIHILRAKVEKEKSKKLLVNLIKKSVKFLWNLTIFAIKINR